MPRAERTPRTKVGRLSERGRLRTLRLFDELVPRIPARSLAEVNRELRAIRTARRTGRRRSLASTR